MTTPSTLWDAARDVVSRLREAGHAGYYAGGCVRDRLLGRPVSDIDIVTSAKPEAVEALFDKTVAVGKQFGVIVVVIDDMQFEVATFRQDGPYRDGRRPSNVAFTDLKGDVTRRDFTINGMVYDPLKDEVIDLVGGRRDLERRLVRAIEDPFRRFQEDKLRMLRAVRFACQLDFTIDVATADAIRMQAATIVMVSAERIAEEFRKILLAPRRADGFEMLHRLGLLRSVLPEIAALEGVPQPPDWHPEGDVWTHTKLALSKLDDPTFELALATLLHDVGKPRTIVISDRIRFNRHESVGRVMAEDICRRLKLSAKETSKIAWLVAQHMVFRDAETMRTATRKRLVLHPHFDELLRLHRADALGGKGDLASYETLRAARDEAVGERPRLKPLLDGHDLMALGAPRGPLLGKLLRELEDAQLEGRVRTREEAVNFARIHIGKA